MDATPSNPVPQSVVPVTMSWLAVSLITTTAVSLAAAHAPPRARLIGLFSIAFGLLIGWLVVRLAEMFEFRPSARLAGSVAAAMTCFGLVGSMWETWRLEESRSGEAAKERIAERLIQQLKEQPEASGAVPVSTPALSRFRRYLSYRIRQLGRWSSPWPELLWGLELMLGTTASYATAQRIQACRQPKPNSDPSKP